MGLYSGRLCPSKPSIIPPIPAEPSIRFPICVICFQQAVDTVCVPCGHAVMCIKCASKLESRKKTKSAAHTAKCPICRSSGSLQQIVHLKFPEDSPPCLIDNAEILALHRSVADATETAMNTAGTITEQLLEALQHARALADHAHDQRIVKLEDIAERLEKLETFENYHPIPRTDGAAPVTSPHSPDSPPPLSLSSSLLVGTSLGEFR